MQLKNLITMRHLEVMNKVILGMSCLMGYAYVMEGFTAWYSMNPYLHRAFMNIISGTYGWAGSLAISCNIFVPQLLWFRKCFEPALLLDAARGHRGHGRHVARALRHHRHFAPAGLPALFVARLRSHAGGLRHPAYGILRPFLHAGPRLLLNRLPFFRHPMLQSKAMAHITRDKFALAVESGGEALDVDALQSILKQAGARTVEVIQAPEPPVLPLPGFCWRSFLP